ICSLGSALSRPPAPKRSGRRRGRPLRKTGATPGSVGVVRSVGVIPVGRVRVAVAVRVIVRVGRRGDRRSGKRATQQTEPDAGATAVVVAAPMAATPMVAAAMPVSRIGGARCGGQRTRGKQDAGQCQPTPVFLAISTKLIVVLHS